MSDPRNIITNITPPRVPLTDERTGLISREWYRFFLSLFTLTGSGQNFTSLTDLQVGPPPVQIDEVMSHIPDQFGVQPSQESSLDQIAELQKQINGVMTQPRPELGTMSQLQQSWLPWVTWDTAPEITPTAVGTMAWDGGTTLGLQMTANVLGRINESGYYYIKASSAITKGQVIMFTGSVGASGVPTGAPATGVTDGTYIMGIAAENIANNGFGLIQFLGTLRGVNTSAFADGDVLWYNPAVTGGLTKTKPSAPNVKVQIAAVISATNNGTVLIRVNAGSVLGGTDSNVQFGTLADKDFIQYDSVLQYWKNVAPGALTKTDDTNVTLTLGGNPSTALLAATSLTLGWTGQLSVDRGGTGTATAFTTGSVVFAGASGVYSQNNSSLFWDNTNGRLGVQTATPNTWFTVRMSHTPPSATAYTSGIQIHDEPSGVQPHFNAGVAYDGGANYGWVQVNSSGGAYNLVLQLAGGNTYIGTKTSYFGAKAAVIAPGSQDGLEVQSNTVGYYAALITNTATSGDNYLVYFGTEANGGTQRGSITYNRAGGLTAYNVTSDYRSKDVFGPVQNSGEVIDQLRIYTGRMKGATINRPMLIAHEAQAVTPYAVFGEKDAVDTKGNPIFQQMDHASYVPLILAELQQIRKRLSQLEN